MKIEQLLSRFVSDGIENILHPIPAPDFSGKWENEYGSTMQIKVDGSSVKGTYTSAVSSSGKAITGPVVGFVAGDVISFSVLWPSTPAKITSWVGQLVIDAEKAPESRVSLETLWQMVVNVRDAQKPESAWTTIHAGADHFRRRD